MFSTHDHGVAEIFVYHVLILVFLIQWDSLNLCWHINYAAEYWLSHSQTNADPPMYPYLVT